MKILLNLSLLFIVVSFLFITNCSPAPENVILVDNIVKTTSAYIVDGDIGINKSSPNAYKIAQAYAKSKGYVIYTC